MDKPRIPPKNQWILSLLICLLSGLILYYIKSYISGFLGAGIMYLLTRKQRNRLLYKRQWKKLWVTIFLLLEISVVFVLPFSLLVRTSSDLFSQYSLDMTTLLKGYNRLISEMENFVGRDLITIENLSFLPHLGANIVQTILTQTYWFAINVAFMLFIFFYLVYHAEKVEQVTFDLLPLPDSHKKEFTRSLGRHVFAYGLGMTVCFVCVGWISYFGYRLFGISIPSFYATITAFGTLIPFIGSILSEITVVSYLFFIGEPQNALGLLLYCIVFISGTEYVIRNRMQKSFTHSSVYILYSSIGLFIGLGLWGLWGVFIGPISIALFAQWIQTFREVTRDKSDYLS